MEGIICTGNCIVFNPAKHRGLFKEELAIPAVSLTKRLK